MYEEENGYEIVNKMSDSAEDLPTSTEAFGAGDANNANLDVQSSLFGDTEQLLQIDPSRKGPRDWFSGCSPDFVQLIFWESPKRSALAFGSVLSLLLCFASFSLISIVAYSTLLLLALSAAFTVYRRIHGTISSKSTSTTTTTNNNNNTTSSTPATSTRDSHPLRALLELDLTVKPSRLASILEPLCDPFNRFVIKSRAIVLIENVLDSAKFAVLMWLMTYIGACFNALSLVILCWVSFFTVPVLYEKNQHLVDRMVGDMVKKVRAALNDVYASIEPKVQTGLDRMPPSVRNAFSQIIGSKPADKIH